MREELKDKTDIIKSFSSYLSRECIRDVENKSCKSKDQLTSVKHVRSQSINTSSQYLTKSQQQNGENIASSQIDSTNIMVCYSKENVINF